MGGDISGMIIIEIQTQAQHKPINIMEHYSHGKQAIDFVAMKKRLEKGIKGSPGGEGLKPETAEGRDYMEETKPQLPKTIGGGNQ